MERIRAAVLLPVRIDVKDVYDETCTELRVTAALDSGGRGRPPRHLRCHRRACQHGYARAILMLMLQHSTIMKGRGAFRCCRLWQWGPIAIVVICSN